MIRLLPGIIDLLLTVVAIVDIALIDPGRVRALPKWAWSIIALLLFIIGPLLWFFVGRVRLEPRNHGRYAGPTPSTSTPSSGKSGPRAPDDDPEFLGRLSREQQQAERIRDLERRLGERRGDDTTPGAGPDDPKSAG